MSNISITGIDAQNSIKIEAEKIISEIEKTLGIKLSNQVTLTLHQTRSEYDSKLGKKSQNWEVGNTNKYDIDMIHIDAFENESCHSKNEFYSIFKHEVIHIFIQEMTAGKTIPMWLNEGFSMVIAGQTSKYQNSEPFFIENDFLSQISTQIGWDKHSNYSAYKYSCLFVNYLINSFTLENTIKLIKSSPKVYTQESFNAAFQEIYKTSLQDVERSFIQNLLN